jgi:RNA polymerase sigma-70 factor (ECF subfamily)
MAEATEAELLQRAKLGDPEAVSEIVRRHQAVIRSYVGRLSPDPVTADDLAQEVFLVALRKIHRIDPRKGIRPYLLGVARNLVRLAWREKVRGREHPGDALFKILAARSPEEERPLEPDVRLTLLRECMRELAPKALDMVLRHYRQEQQCDEIAGALGTTPGNVRSILARARQLLRECMEPKLDRAPV